MVLLLSGTALSTCAAGFATRPAVRVGQDVGSLAVAGQVSTTHGSTADNLVDVATFQIPIQTAAASADVAVVASSTRSTAATNAATYAAAVVPPMPPSASPQAAASTTPEPSNRTPEVVPSTAKPPAPRTAPMAGSAAAEIPSTWTVDLYSAAAERYQDPDYRACTATAVLSMLNTVGSDGRPTGFVWQPTTAYATEEAILAYERDHMTMLATSAGADPHGWRNALNYFGWGSVDADVYRDMSYDSFQAAAKATVTAIAMTHKPVGILAHAGAHAEFVTGYQVFGADPATGSSDFTVIAVNLTDPLRSNGHRDTWVTIAQWQAGDAWVRFSPYRETDSPYVDPIDGQAGRSEWYGRWVLVAPVM